MNVGLMKAKSSLSHFVVKRREAPFRESLNTGSRINTCSRNPVGHMV